MEGAAPLKLNPPVLKLMGPPPAADKGCGPSEPPVPVAYSRTAEPSAETLTPVATMRARVKVTTHPEPDPAERGLWLTPAASNDRLIDPRFAPPVRRAWNSPLP